LVTGDARGDDDRVSTADLPSDHRHRTAVAVGTTGAVADGGGAGDGVPDGDPAEPAVGIEPTT
jgi:hypothetical protein